MRSVHFAAALGLLVSPVLAATPARAAFPGANGLLVFEREMPAGDHTQTDLFTIKPDGTGLRRLTSTPNQNEFGPAWNAVGRKIVFWRTRAPFGPGSVWVMDGAGGHQRALTHGAIDARDPVWNPAGTRIAFTTFQGTNPDLWTMRASDGNDRKRLTSGPAVDFEPAWSPDGTRVAFTRGSEQGDPGDIHVLDIRSHRITRITHTPAYDHQVAWGPGGGRIVFERDWATSSSIFIADRDGSHLLRLTRGPYFDTGPAFSPDRRFITFGSSRGTNLSDLWMINTDGKHPHVLHPLPGGEGFPDWQPRH